MYNFLSFSVFLVFGCFMLLGLLFSGGVIFSSLPMVNSNLFLFDSLSFYLIVLVLFLGLYSLVCLNISLSSSTCFFLFLSLFFSAVCFCVNHSVFFWCFYELAMLPLLYLIFRDSPYSERFIAGWYFAGYLLITSLPLILILLYFSFVNGSFYFNCWSADYSAMFAYVTLAFVFFTKVPLSPFHTWLPIVHAEATSIVSIFLSGYIMKLGLLGVYRCSPFLFSGGFVVYLFLCCFFSVFFLIVASKELDGKRWLAFLSLSHIVVPFLGFFICSWESVSLTFLFCLGHGLSAGLVFGFLWYFYDGVNTRNWLLLKAGINGKLSMLILTFGMLSLCSFPPTLQFFCEVNLLIESLGSYVYVLYWCCYLFFGGLVPLVLCGHLLIRNECSDAVLATSRGFIYLFLFLGVWCYLGILVF